MDSTRITGFITLATGLAALVLLAFHPGGQATDFAGVLKEEAANRAINAMVHGGFILVLAIQLACYAIFAGRLGWTKPLAVAGMVFVAVGAGLQMASLLVDGLMIPQIAARYVAAAPDRLPYARSLFLLCGTAVQLLMPMGLFFQGAGVTSWGGALAGIRRGSGIAAVMAGALAALAAAAVLASGQMMLLFVAIVLLAAFAGIAGLALVRRWI
jgi:hypothetical protein